ncbi:MAG: DNA-processing protein DprA [Patescibacteria group bacterium]
MTDYEIKKITINDPLYPPLLKEINNPPKQLYYVGKFPEVNLFPLAIVGSRQSDKYGEDSLSYLLSAEILDKTLIISGLARGIDTKAHLLAHHTIAVLGTGLDKASFYPPENWALCQSIVDRGGLVISEYAPGTKANYFHFPQRNRIIAGLSQAVLVVQAKKRSGALITARLALEDGRDVLAVPGPIFNELSLGVNQLIAQGAIPITSPDDLKQCLTENS